MDMVTCSHFPFTQTVAATSVLVVVMITLFSESSEYVLKCTYACLLFARDKVAIESTFGKRMLFQVFSSTNAHTLFIRLNFKYYTKIQMETK